VSFVDHFDAGRQRLPSYTNHLYCRAAPPPVADAVHAMVVPVVCGDMGSASNVTVLTGWAVAETPPNRAAGNARVEVALMSIRAALSKAQARISIDREKSRVAWFL
jgi:hypothetical protein